MDLLLMPSSQSVSQACCDSQKDKANVGPKEAADLCLSELVVMFHNYHHWRIKKTYKGQSVSSTHMNYTVKGPSRTKAMIYKGSEEMKYHRSSTAHFCALHCTLQRLEITAYIMATFSRSASPSPEIERTTPYTSPARCITPPFIPYVPQPVDSDASSFTHTYDPIVRMNEMRERDFRDFENKSCVPTPGGSPVWFPNDWPIYDRLGAPNHTGYLTPMSRSRSSCSSRRTADSASHSTQSNIPMNGIDAEREPIDVIIRAVESLEHYVQNMSQSSEMQCAKQHLSDESWKPQIHTTRRRKSVSVSRRKVEATQMSPRVTRSAARRNQA